MAGVSILIFTGSIFLLIVEHNEKVIEKLVSILIFTGSIFLLVKIEDSNTLLS